MLDDLTAGGTGSKMRDHWVAIVDAAHDKLAAKIDERKQTHVVNVFEQFEQELAPHLAPFIAHLADDPNIPQPVRDLVAELIAPTHLGSSIVLGIAIGAVLSPVFSAATAPLVSTISNTLWANALAGPVPLQGVPPSPDLLAAAVLKGVLHEPQAATVAEQSGTSSTHFHTMVETAGQSVGIAEALLLLRRKQIDMTEFLAIAHYSNMNNRFIPDVLKLIYGPPPPGEVIAGALKGHLPIVDATRMLGEAGIDPANFGWMRASAGRPPGIEGLLQLWNRSAAGDTRSTVSEPVVDAAIRQSDINDDFLPYVKELRWYIPPPRSIVPMLRDGAITDARALQLLEQHGLSAQDAQAFVAEAHHSKASTGKELTASQVVRMYGDRFIDRTAATSRLQAAAFPPDQITLLLDFADHARQEKLTAALTSKVGALYTAHKIDRSAATVALDAGPVPAAVQADLFHVWDLERAAMVHHLTPAQIIGAYRRGEIGALECKTRLLALGVQPADLGILVADGYPPGKGAEARAAAAAVVAA